MIDIDSFYQAAGLLPQKDWEIQRLALFREMLFKKITHFLENKDVDIPSLNRGVGKTTKIIIEAIYAEWYGYETVIAYKSVVEQYFAKYRYETFKKKVYSAFGPPLNAGKTTMITKGSRRHYGNQNIILDID
jgi:hypothetical protein